MEISFKGQLAFVTGGTRGIGAAVARGILDSGGKVVITGTGGDRPDWAGGLPSGMKDSVHYYRLDFLEPGWEGALDGIVERHPDISVCVNNAGINIISDIRRVKMDDLDKVLRVDLAAPAMVISRVSGQMAKNGYGRIVNISSIFGIKSRAERSSYSAAKAGLIGQTRGAALDLAAEGVLVNAVAPGFVETDLTKKILGEKGMKEIIGRIPVGRMASPEDIVPAVLFLASGLNTYITGQVLTADGGFIIG